MPGQPKTVTGLDGQNPKEERSAEPNFHVHCVSNRGWLNHSLPHSLEPAIMTSAIRQSPTPPLTIQLLSAPEKLLFYLILIKLTIPNMTNLYQVLSNHGVSSNAQKWFSQWVTWSMSDMYKDSESVKGIMETILTVVYLTSEFLSILCTAIYE